MNDVWEDAPDTVDDGDTVLNGQPPKNAEVGDEDTVIGNVSLAAPLEVDDTVLSSDASDDTVLNALDDDTIIGLGDRQDNSDDTVIGNRDRSTPNNSRDDDTLIDGAHSSDDSTILNERPRPAVQPVAHDELPPLPPLPPMPTAASRPAPQFFASLALPDGRLIPVDGIVLIGRKPRSERIISGVLPTLVQVPSPQGVVSSTHLEVRHEGSAVLVTDVGSSNGTALIIQGQPPRRLRAGEPTVVIPGTLLDLGDGVVLRVQPFERGDNR